MNPQEALLGQLSFKGKAVRFYKSGGRLYLKTTRYLYKIHQSGEGFRLQQMRAYAR